MAPLPTIDIDKTVQVEALRLLRHRFGFEKMARVFEVLNETDPNPDP